jgi:hypothetical protein
MIAVAGSDRASRKSFASYLPVNWETGYKYGHRAHYKDLFATALLMNKLIVRVIAQRVIPVMRGVV